MTASKLLRSLEYVPHLTVETQQLGQVVRGKENNLRSVGTAKRRLSMEKVLNLMPIKELLHYTNGSEEAKTVCYRTLGVTKAHRTCTSKVENTVQSMDDDRNYNQIPALLMSLDSLTILQHKAF